MMPKLIDIFDAKNIGAYYEAMKAEIPTDSYVLSKFPNQRTPGLQLSWIKGYNDVPVALQPSAFDTKASVRDRIGIAKIITEMPFFREAMRIGELERQELLTTLQAAPDLAKPMILRLYDDAKNLIDGAIVQARRMACSVLQTGTIAVAAGDTTGRTAAYDYNYDPNGKWAASNKKTLAAGAKWTEGNKANSNPIKDLLEAKRIMRLKGVLVSEVIMNSETFEGMIVSESIAKAMNPVGAANIIVTDEEARRFIEQKTGLRIYIEDGIFKDENKVERYYLDTGYVVLAPAGPLGRMHYGVTPEEYDLRTGNTAASVQVVGGGIAVTTYVEPHPVNIQVYASAIILPSFEAMDRIYTLKVQ